MHVAVDNLQREQRSIFAQFLTGILGYLSAHITSMWIYFRPRIALTVSIPLVIFFLAIVYYVIMIVNNLVLSEDRALTGQIGAWGPYERIQDLDEEIYKPLDNKHYVYKTGRMMTTSRY